MSILTDALARGYAAQDAAGAQRRIEWTPTPTGESEYPTVRRQEFLPTASREENHRQSQRAMILARLRLGPATTWEMMNMGGSGFSSRIAELRKEGWKIKAKRIDRHAMYELVQVEP